MHSLKVHSNERACRKSGRLGMDQVWCRILYDIRSYAIWTYCIYDICNKYLSVAYVFTLNFLRHYFNNWTRFKKYFLFYLWHLIILLPSSSLYFTNFLPISISVLQKNTIFSIRLETLYTYTQFISY